MTFIDNHDTGSTQNHWPFPSDNEKVMQGYAYILTHPGIPMVFWDHYYDWGYKAKIKALMDVRKNLGIHSTSTLSIQRAETGLYAAIVGGKVAVKLGPNSWSPGYGWTMKASGINYAVWTEVGATTASSTDETEYFALGLEQNYPNPVIGSTTIAFTVPAKQQVTLKLYNTLSAEVAKLASGEYEAGRHTVVLNSKGLKPGIYFYHMMTGNEKFTRRLVINK